MKKIVFKIFPIVILPIFLLSCYTQMKLANQQIEEPVPVYVDEEYYYLDSTQSEIGSVTNIYVYTPPYYYDPWYNPWYDPWYWRPSSHWGWYVGFSFYWGDPYWYPWGWYGRCCYPYVVPYAGYFPPYYWNPYYYPPYYHHDSRSYAKRPFDRRSPVSPRSVARGGGRGGNTPVAKEIDPRTTRTATRGIATTSGTRGSSGNSSRIVRRDLEGKRLVTRDDASSRQTITKRTSRSSSNRTAVKSRSSSRRSSEYKPKSTKSRSSASSGYSNRRSSNRSSGSYKPSSSSGGSRSSSGRSSSGSGSSSSGSGSRSSSGGGSRTSTRK